MITAAEAGSRHFERGAALPHFLQFDSEPSSNGWASIANRRSTFEEQLGKSGWTYFFLAGRIKKSAFGFNREAALDSALKQLATTASSQKCNSFEIADVTTRQFSGVFRVSVSAHARHFQEGPASSGR
jgi:hypothetical protein